MGGTKPAYEFSKQLLLAGKSVCTSNKALVEKHGAELLAIAKEKRKIILSFNRWRECILSSFGYDPLKCPCCGKTMRFLELYHKHQHISLNEMYERAMGRLPSFSSA